jgi:hypothetical protein
VLKKALCRKNYLLLLSVFFVYGFHAAFITTHLPDYITDAGFPEFQAAWAISLIGLST